MVLNLLLILIPVALALDWTGANPLLVFVTSALAIVPLAGLMATSTEQLASYVGATVGGLMNATMGNAPELIIALFALKEGLNDVVKASIAGSIIGNILLVLGVSMLAGGLRHDRQRFNATAASMNAGLLAVAAIALVVPAIFHLASIRQERELSLEIAVVLFVIYLLSLVFTLKTHRHMFAAAPSGSGEGSEPEEDRWSRRRAITVLALATLGIAVMSETLTGSIEGAATRAGLTSIFVGVILLAIIGNAAEMAGAVRFAAKNKMDLTIGTSVGASLQIALFVAPVLVFASYGIGKPLDLLFTQFEVAAVFIAVLIVVNVTRDGESNWMEGVMLVGVYLILAYAFYFLPV
ncbi:MAG TPA: calcium/proton exchanger [Nitrospiraceae bacterium]|nr:calcium/proton exchanger [Nitrospiraceae bacterium]